MIGWLQTVIASLPPGLAMALGGLVLLALRGKALKAGLVALPVLSYAHLLWLPSELVLTTRLFGFDLVPVRIDSLSMVWGHVFHWVAILAAVYALHVKDRVQHAAALAYAGCATAAVFAGDLWTLFVYWELTAVTSVFLIWAGDERAKKDRDPEDCYRTGMRYLVIQVASGVLLLAGICLRVGGGDSGGDSGGGVLEFGQLSTGSLFEAPLWVQLVFLAFGVKAAFPFLHSWMQDAYPKGTHTGTVFLSAFTTKMAIYALARGFAGTELLIYLGVVMAVFPVFLAAVENDLRKVLAYSLNIQLGFMCVGIGIGNELALQGAAGHAFACVLYQALLFQSMGTVLWSVGTCKATELGGLLRKLPVTAVCCMVGAASISVFPLTSGFVTKSMTLSAAAEAHMTFVWLALVFASVGVLEHSGIKIPFLAFLAPTKKDWSRVERPPWNMQASMVVTAVLCLGIGMFPGVLYRFLQFEIAYKSYSTLHVVGQLQLLLFALAAFVWLWRSGLYPHEERSTNLDFDWTYRRLLPGAWRAGVRRGVAAWNRAGRATEGALQGGLVRVQSAVGHGAALTHVRTIREIAVWVLAALGVGLVWVYWLG